MAVDGRGIKSFLTSRLLSIRYSKRSAGVQSSASQILFTVSKCIAFVLHPDHVPNDALRHAGFLGNLWRLLVSAKIFMRGFQRPLHQSRGQALESITSLSVLTKQALKAVLIRRGGPEPTLTRLLEKQSFGSNKC